jgi:N-acetylmuramoyl-L-alanine amidase
MNKDGWRIHTVSPVQSSVARKVPLNTDTNSVNAFVTASQPPAIALRFVPGLLALAIVPCLAQTGLAQTVAPPAVHAWPRPHPVAPMSIPSRTSAQSTGVPTAQAAAPSTPPPTGPLNRLVIVLDPAHGGVDSGSRIGDSVLEKDVTLALADKLRSLLAARGFTVVMTRDSDAAVEPGPTTTPLTLDDRAGLANHARAVACLSLHATGAGQGVHLYSSELTAAAGESNPLPWLTAQAAWVAQSRALERRIGDALTRAGIPLVLSSASVRPVDSLTCPALVVEVAPQSDEPKSIEDNGYQQRIAQAIAAALLFWRDQAQPPPRLAAAASITASAGSSSGRVSAERATDTGRRP